MYFARVEFVQHFEIFGHVQLTFSANMFVANYRDFGNSVMFYNMAIAMNILATKFFVKCLITSSRRSDWKSFVTFINKIIL